MASQIWILYQIFKNIYGSGTLDYRHPPDDISQEGERLDLRPHEVDKDLLVEGRTLAQVLRRLEADGVHDQRYEFRHLRVYEVLPMKKTFIRIRKTVFVNTYTHYRLKKGIFLDLDFFYM
jgi:hypothetical protein